MTDDHRNFTVLQLPNGQFAKGNPGRQIGTKNRVSRETLQSIFGMKDVALEELQNLITQGDMRAIVFVLDRILPSKRTVQLDDTSPANILDLLASGDLAPDEASAIATTIARLVDVGLVADLERRISELETVAVARKR